MATPISAISNPTYRYVGSFSDPSYGPDYEGQLFESVEDARLSLSDMYRLGDRCRIKRVHLNGEITRDFMPCVSNEATLWLYRIEPVQLAHLNRDREQLAAFEDGKLPDYRPGAEVPTVDTLEFPTYTLSIGARGGIKSERV